MPLKKIFVLIVVLILAVALSFGCNKKSEINTKPENNSNKVVSEKNTDVPKESIKESKNNEMASGSKNGNNLRSEKVKEIEPIPEIKLASKDVILDWADKNGKMMMSAKASDFSGNQKEGKLVLRNFSGTLFEKGKKSAYIEAPLATATSKDKIVQVDKGVRIKSFTNNSSMVANKIVWLAEKDKIYAYDGVLTTEYGKITGKFFELNTALETFEVSDNPKPF